MSIKRYGWEQNPITTYFGLVPDNFGAYVLHADHIRDRDEHARRVAERAMWLSRVHEKEWTAGECIDAALEEVWPGGGGVE